MHAVIGAGPVGRTVAEQLLAPGEEAVVATRSGSGPDGARLVAADASDARALAAAVGDAEALFHCAHAPYSAKEWEAELPRTEQAVLTAAAGRRVVFPESLYSYTATDRPMTEDGPRDAAGGKRGVRTRLLAARAASGTPTVSVVASDVFGPYARNAHVGSSTVPKLLAGKTVRCVGDPDALHSFTYVPDYAAAMVAAAALPDAPLVLHAPTLPARTQRQTYGALAEAAGTTAKVAGLPTWALRLPVLPTTVREMSETAYQFTGPFVLDSTRSEQLLGLRPTPMAEAAAATVAWWRSQA